MFHQLAMPEYYALTYDNDNLLAGLETLQSRETLKMDCQNQSAIQLTVNRTNNGYGEIDSETSAVGNAVYGYQITSRDNAGRIQENETIGSASMLNIIRPIGKIDSSEKDGQAVESMFMIQTATEHQPQAYKRNK